MNIDLKVEELAKHNESFTVEYSESTTKATGTTKTIKLDVKVVEKLPWYQKLWYFLFQYDKKLIKYNK